MAEQETDPIRPFLEKAWNTPGARELIQRAAKIAYPNAEIPELAIRDMTQLAEKKIDEKAQALDQKIAQFDAKQALAAAHVELKSHGYTPDQIKDIEKIMVDEGVGLHANAAVIYDARTKPVRGISPSAERPGYTSMNPNKAYQRGQYAPFFQGIMDGPFQNPGEDWAREKVDQILTDFATDRPKAERQWTDDTYWPTSPSYQAPASKA